MVVRLDEFTKSMLEGIISTLQVSETLNTRDLRDHGALDKNVEKGKYKSAEQRRDYASGRSRFTAAERLRPIDLRERHLEEIKFSLT